MTRYFNSNEINENLSLIADINFINNPMWNKINCGVINTESLRSWKDTWENKHPRLSHRSEHTWNNKKTKIVTHLQRKAEKARGQDGASANPEVGSPLETREVDGKKLRERSKGTLFTNFRSTGKSLKTMFCLYSANSHRPRQKTRYNRGPGTAAAPSVTPPPCEILFGRMEKHKNLIPKT